MILGNKVGGGREPKTYLIEQDGMAYTAVVVEDVHIFDAQDKDVRVGKTFASDDGVMLGTNDSPYCRVTNGVHEVEPGVEFMLKMEAYGQWNYTVLHCMMAPKSNPMRIDKYTVDKVETDDDGNETVTKVVYDTKPVYDEEGNPVLDENKRQVYGKQIATVVTDASTYSIRFKVDEVSNLVNGTDEPYLMYFFVAKEEVQ